MNTDIHEWRALKIKMEIRVHSCSFVAKTERLNTHTEIAIIASFKEVSAYSRNANGAVTQSEWVEAPQTPDAKPIKLVLPVLKK